MKNKKSKFSIVNSFIVFFSVLLASYLKDEILEKFTKYGPNFIEKKGFDPYYPYRQYEKIPFTETITFNLLIESLFIIFIYSLIYFLLNSIKNIIRNKKSK